MHSERTSSNRRNNRTLIYNANILVKIVGFQCIKTKQNKIMMKPLQLRLIQMEKGDDAFCYKTKNRQIMIPGP